MTNPPYGNAPGGQWPQPGPPVGPPPAWSSAAPKQSRAPILVALAAALIAVAVAIGAWFKPTTKPPQSSDSTPSYSSQQTADAKKAICAAYAKTLKAVQGAAQQKNSDPDNEAANIVNVRLAFHVTTDYFQSQLAANPAIDPNLKSAFQDLISSYDELILAQIANSSKEDLDAAYAKTDSADKVVVEACK